MKRVVYNYCKDNIHLKTYLLSLTVKVTSYICLPQVVYDREPTSYTCAEIYMTSQDLERVFYTTDRYTDYL